MAGVGIMENHLDETSHPSKLRSMLDLKLTVGQVITGAFVMISTVVGMVTWTEAHFETKQDATRREELMERRLTKVEDSFDRMSRVQTDIYGDVREINAILKEQRSAREHK